MKIVFGRSMRAMVESRHRSCLPLLKRFQTFVKLDSPAIRPTLTALFRCRLMCGPALKLD